MRPTPGTSKIGRTSWSAGRLRLLDARIDVINRKIGHPAFGHAIELQRGERKQPADVIIAYRGHSIGAVRHRHGFETTVSA
jgi:hypothetical protein